MKRLLVVFMALAMVFSAFALVAAADSFVDEEDIIYDLLPTKSMLKTKGLVDAHDIDLSFDVDGSLVCTITGSDPRLNVKWMDGTTIYAGGNIDLNDPAYFCIDYGVTGKGGIETVNGDRPAIFYYTRKDKAPDTFAQLWFVSMTVSADYASYRTQHHLDETGGYVVWNWGEYVSSSPAKLFDDKIHQFVNMELPLVGEKGDKVVLYSLCIVNNPEPHGLGDVRPDPDKEESSEAPSEDPVTSEPASDEPVSDEPVSDEPVSDEPVSDEPVSDEPVSDEPVSDEPASDEPASDEPASDEPVPVESEAEPQESQTAPESAPEESKPAEQTGGMPWWGWLAIGVGAVAVCCAIVGIILKVKKK